MTDTRAFSKPRVVVSQCLEFAACRYDGQKVSDPFVRALAPHVEFLPVCPEIEIGLGVPRPTIKIVRAGSENRLVRPSDGLDLTARMKRFSAAFLARAGGIDGFLLKSRSPSCALKDCKRYPRVEPSASSGRGAGIFGQEVLDRFDGLAVEDEARLNDRAIREHFFTKLFTLAEWRRVRASGSAARLVRFQSEHKLLLMSYHQANLRRLGRLAAEVRQAGWGATVDEYEGILKVSLARPPRAGSHVNVLQHAFGYFSNSLNQKEKEHFMRRVGRYAAGKTPLSELLSIFRSWLERFDDPYLKSQRYFEPFPEPLGEL